MDFEVIKINEDTWRIENNGVRFFLLLGEAKALLVDSGMSVHNAKEIAMELTSLPIELINTHADIDHVGSNDEFEWVYMNPSELSNYHNSQKKNGKIVPVWDGDVLNLGNRELQIIALPGHTPGSIAILDKKYKVLFSGDAIQDGSIFMFGVQREISAYYHGLVRLKKYKDEINSIYPSHGTIPISSDYIDLLIGAADKIIAGDYTASDTDFMGIPIKKCDMGFASFLLEK